MPRASRKAASRAGMDAKLEQVFAGRTFDIVREIHLPEGQAFVTRFGHYGRHGYVLKDRETGELLVIGRRLLKVAHDRFLCVSIPKRHLPRIVGAYNETKTRIFPHRDG